jgi:hypothetical protein
MRLTGAKCPARSAVTTLAVLLVPWLILVGARADDVAGGAGTEARSAREEAADPLVDLNQAFREAYAHCRQRLVERSGPVIVVEGDSLVLLHNGKRSEAKMVPDVYHTLKAVSHVPLAVYVMLVPLADAPLDKECLEGLRAYRRRVVQAELSLKDRRLSDEILLRQQEILRAALRFLDFALDKKQVNADELYKFTRDLGSKLLASAADAAHAELDGLDKQVRAWRATLTADEWQKLHVVIMGSALPRQGNLATQYFAHLLGEKGEGRRIVYAESIFEESRALNLLGTHLLDTRIGSAFFDDAERLHRDLLSDAAREHLKQISPNLKQISPR